MFREIKFGKSGAPGSYRIRGDGGLAHLCKILIFLNTITTDGCPTRRGVRRVGIRALAPIVH
jgi:hypothetical protein